jgi:two-component system, NtrC family, C4-dicarboxylate transport response regulator DctD
MHEKNFDGMQVLLVEDDAVVRKGAKQALELAGLRVQACASAEEAVPYLSPEFAGILISDVKLPGMDGLELLRTTVSRDPSLPVILVTGHGDVSMAVGAMRQGAYDFIEKPAAARWTSGGWCWKTWICAGSSKTATASKHASSAAATPSTKYASWY